MNLTYFSPVPTGHVLLFRFLFIKDQLNTHLLLKNIKSGNSVSKPAAAAAAAAKLIQSCPTLCDPMDCNLPGSPIPGILQARTLEWVAISFSNAGK